MPSQDVTFPQWFIVFAPFQLYLVIVVALVCFGEHGEERNPLKQFFRPHLLQP